MKTFWNKWRDTITVIAILVFLALCWFSVEYYGKKACDVKYQYDSDSVEYGIMYDHCLVNGKYEDYHTEKPSWFKSYRLVKKWVKGADGQFHAVDNWTPIQI